MKPSHGDIFVVVGTGVVVVVVVDEAGKVLVVGGSVEEGAVDEDVDGEIAEEDVVEEDTVEVDVADEDIVDKVVVTVSFVGIFVVVVKKAPVDTTSCSVISTVPVVLLLRKIGTLKIEQSAPSNTASVRKSNNFRDLLSIAFD